MDVVIPAHNEESAIARPVRQLAAAGLRGVVVANACSDHTADAARTAAADGVTVLETPIPGKAHALNLGDECCSAFPRAYLDADVELDGAGLAALGAAIEEPGALLAVPALRVADEGASWLVRSYLRAWRALPSVRQAGAGRGVYVLSEEGHARVFPLPVHLIADDGYVDRTIPLDRRVVLDEIVVTVRPERDIRAMIRRRIRVSAGNRQLDALGLRPHGGGAGARALLGLVRAGAVSPLDVAVFIGVGLVVRGLDRLRRARGREVRWGTTR